MYLLRLLFVRLGLDQPERHHQLRLLASSASLPVDDNDANGKKASLDYLYDAFAKEPLNWASEAGHTGFGWP